jgi:hypothetical protein
MQLKSIKQAFNNIDKCLSSPKSIRILRALALVSLAGLAINVCANTAPTTGTDLLKGTESDLLKTIGGTGKRYLYLAEGILATLTGILTRNWMALTGVIVIAVFVNVMLAMVNAVNVT